MKHWVRLLLIVIPIAIGVVFLIVAQERNRQRERLLMLDMRQQADKHEAVLAGAVEDVGTEYRQVRAMAAQASNAVLFVTGKTLHMEEPRIVEAVVAPVRTAADTEAAPAVEPPAPPADTDDAAMPAGIGMSPAELRRRHERQARARREAPASPPREPDADGAKGASTGADAAPVEPAAPPEPATPPVVVRAREILSALDTIRAETKALAVLEERADKAARRFDEASKPFAAVKPLETLEGYAESALRSREVSASAFAAAGDALGELLSIKSAREQAEREREEQERRQQEEVERQAKIKEETAIAKEMEEAVSEQVLAFQFEDALAGIENLLARIETAPARKSLKTLQERCRRIQSLHEFLIERINAEPFRWGWGSGTAARDITAADATKITVAGGAVRWDKIPEAQLFRIVEHYQETSSVRATRRAEQWVGAAILAREHGATGRAAAYGANAVELLPRLRSDLERLAPIKR